MDKKRFLTFTISVSVLVLAGVTGTAAAQTTAPDCSTIGYDGAGTTTSPYEVTNVSQLQCMGNTSTSTSLNENFTQVSDIDASGTSSWNGGSGFDPIGELGVSSFDGVLNGNGHSITGIEISRGDETTVGLFEVVGSSGTVADATVEGAEVAGDGGGSEKGVGILAGYNQGTLRDVSVSGSVTEDIDGVGPVGTVAGANDGQVLNSSASGTVEGNDTKATGGLVGFNFNPGTVDASKASTDVTASQGSTDTGGLVGFVSSADVLASYATGDVNGSDKVGGAIGLFDTGTVNQTYAVGEVTGSSGIGGLIGDSGGTEPTSGSFDAGWGIHDGNSVALDGVGTQATGVTDSYWDVNTTGQSTSNGGIGLTTEEMKGDAAKINMNFDFQNTWDVVDSPAEISYPFLLNNAQTSAPGLEERTGAGEDCLDRRSVSRGQEGQACPGEDGLRRDGSRGETDRGAGRDGDTSRRDRSRGEGRNRGR